MTRGSATRRCTAGWWKSGRASVAAVLIRDVDVLRPSRRDRTAQTELQRIRDRGVPAFLAESSAAMAGHLVRLDLLPSESVEAVQAAADRDRDRPALARAAVTAAVGLGGAKRRRG